MKILKNKTTVLLFLLILVIMHSNNFFLDTYILLKSNYDERMTKVYGDCGKESYGFIKKNINKHKKDHNLEILNPNFSFNNSYWMGYLHTNKQFDKDKLILINNKNNLIKIEENKFKLLYQNKNLGFYKILNQEQDCFFLQKYD